MVLSVAAFVDDEKVAKELQKCFDARTISLAIAYSIPGYADAPRETKNFVYDAIIAKVMSLM